MNEREFAKLMAQASEDVKKLNQPAKPAKGKRKRSILEQKFYDYWLALTPSVPLEEEYIFDARKPRRRWKFDFAHPASHVAVELEGGIHSFGRHNRAQGYMDDAEKYTQAALQGWKVLRYTTGQVTLSAAKEVYVAITGREPHSAIEQAHNPYQEGKGARKPARPVGRRRVAKARKKRGA